MSEDLVRRLMYDVPGKGDGDRYEAAREIARLRRELRYLRHYGNKDCTHMADEAMARGDMDDGERRHSDPSKP